MNNNLLINHRKNEAYKQYILDRYYYVPEEGRIYSYVHNKPLGSIEPRHGYMRLAIYRFHDKKGKTNFLYHRVCWLLHYGDWPDGLIDHINHDLYDNRIENLRIVDWSGSNTNKRVGKNSTSGIKNVTWCSELNKWKVIVTKNNKAHYGGVYKYKREAAIAAKLLRKILHGDYRYDK